MNIFGIIIIVALAGLITWLVVDTVIYVVKRTKEKKKKEVKQDSTTNE